MPESSLDLDMDDDLYHHSKNLRLSKTGKRMRRLIGLERTHYKQTWEVKKRGFNLAAEHRLDDGNMRCTGSSLTYSLNRKKRWLLPGIIEQRIRESQSTVDASTPKQPGDQLWTVDENLKIVMYENENIRYGSNCVRYSNSQMEPRFIENNGRVFNSNTLSKWLNFETRPLRSRHRRVRPRTSEPDRVNLPNFGVERRPGFFPSEVTYEFLYPRRCGPTKHGRSSLTYDKCPHNDYYRGRYDKDTNKRRRQLGRVACSLIDPKDEVAFYSADVEEDDTIFAALYTMDSGEQCRIESEDLNDTAYPTVDFPMDCFIPSYTVSPLAHRITPEIIIDRKAHKFFEPPATSSASTATKSSSSDGIPLCSIACPNESDFLDTMQRSVQNISQANLSPPTFLQRTSSSSFSVIYAYSRSASLINARLSCTGLAPKIVVNQAQTTLTSLIDLVNEKLNDTSIPIPGERSRYEPIHVDALRGCLPLPVYISKQMILVQPHATDKPTALRNEKILDESGAPLQSPPWFNTVHHDYAMLDCSVCCETLTENDAYELLPCRHTICQDCLTTYVRTSVATATYSSTKTSPLTCFQPDCSTELNPSFVQAFVSLEIYQTYHQSRLDRCLFSSGHYRKCPSRQCSNLLIVADETKQSLMCSCGQRVCSKCLEEYHFPATCKQFQSYVTRLRASGDHLLSKAKLGDNAHCYIAEGKNCPNCGEFVEKNGGCPHMTCKCGNEYCWMCLRRWATHNTASCHAVPESKHELRSSTSNRLFNKAVNHRRQRNQYTFDLLSLWTHRSKVCSPHTGILLSTYVDLNTLAEFIYVVLQRRRTDTYIRAMLCQTVRRLEVDSSRLRSEIEVGQCPIDYVNNVRARLKQTVLNLIHLKNKQVLAS